MSKTSSLVLTAVFVVGALITAGAVSPFGRWIPAIPVDSAPSSALLATLSSVSTGSDTAAAVAEKFLRTNPAAISTLLANPPQAEVIVSWWQALADSSRDAFSRAAPQLIGNLDGLPYDVRDAANRRYLAQSLAAATASAARPLGSSGGRAQAVFARHHLAALHEVERALVRPRGEPIRQLLTFDPTGQVRAAVVVGNLATADYVSYLVPGMLFTVWGQMYDWTVIAADLQREQSEWLHTLSTTDSSLTAKTSASVSWIGYITPGALDVASLDSADVGATYLKSAVQGLQASRTSTHPYITLVTHSYGSTAAMLDLDGGGLSVDALVIVGSPGGTTRSAASLAVPDGNVFVGEAALDPVAHTGFYGADPGSAAFGAHRMDVAASTDAITGAPLSAAVGHLGYFDVGTTAMRNLALIALDQSALVSRG